MADPADELTRVYSRIMAFRQNVQGEAVRKEVCGLYDDLVDRAQAALSKDLQEFKVNGRFPTRNNQFHFGDGVLSQIDGLINYLRSMIAPEKVQRIGFQAP